jgi:uncharacterized membrane-anchored protein YitT (DUF2179 family)
LIFVFVFFSFGFIFGFHFFSSSVVSDVAYTKIIVVLLPEYHSVTAKQKTKTNKTKTKQNKKKNHCGCFVDILNASE